MTPATLDQLPATAPTRERIERFEALLLQAPQTDLGTKHFLVRGPAGNLYGRQILIPARTYISGAASKRDHLVQCVGDIDVTTDTGVKRLTGCHTFIAKAGHKRAGSAYADTVWTNFYVVTADNIGDIEDEIAEEAERLQTRNPSLSMAAPQLIEA